MLRTMIMNVGVGVVIMDTNSRSKDSTCFFHEIGRHPFLLRMQGMNID
jgi:hypothetical protein